MTFHWELAAAFAERAERLNLHGLHFQHVVLCERRAWMYLHGINFAQWNMRVQIGIAKHSTHYQRDHSVQGLFGLAPDRVDWKQHIVYEHKGTTGAAEAVSDQAAFYALMLSIASGYTWSAIIQIFNSNKQRIIPLDPNRLDRLWQSSLKLEQLALCAKVPNARAITLCANCSLAGFCQY